MPKRLSATEVHSELMDIWTTLEAFEGDCVPSETARKAAQRAVLMLALGLLSLKMKEDGEIPPG